MDADTNFLGLLVCISIAVTYTQTGNDWFNKIAGVLWLALGVFMVTKGFGIFS